MNLIRLLRSQAGVTQQALATLAKTSQSTIAAYESGVKSPTLETLQRLAFSLGLELVAIYTPRLTREDQRSLSYHRVLARKLQQNPISVIKRAKQTLRKMRKHQPGAKALFDRWCKWLNLSSEELISKILDPGMMARDMRQVTPFAGLLKPQERVRVLNQFRREYGAYETQRI